MTTDQPDRPAASGSGEPPDDGPQAPDDASEQAMMREILRRQERHREGGVEPGLDETDEEPGPGA